MKIRYLEDWVAGLVSTANYTTADFVKVGFPFAILSAVVWYMFLQVLNVDGASGGGYIYYGMLSLCGTIGGIFTLIPGICIVGFCLRFRKPKKPTKPRANIVFDGVEIPSGKESSKHA